MPGMTVALLSMSKRETAVFLFQPEYGFGQLGCPPRDGDTTPQQSGGQVEKPKQALI